jgi:hypothetical protein
MNRVLSEKTQKLLIEADEQMLLNLWRSVERLERDLSSLVQSVPKDQSSYVLSSFRELKKELKAYDELRNAPVNENFMKRLAKKLGLFGSAKSKSSEDLRQEPSNSGPDNFLSMPRRPPSSENRIVD